MTSPPPCSAVEGHAEICIVMGTIGDDGRRLESLARTLELDR